MGTLTGLLGAYTGVLAFLISRKSHNATILRDEFSRHRIRVETALIGVRSRADRAKTILSTVGINQRIIEQFGREFKDSEVAVEALNSELMALDARAIFGDGWDKSIHIEKSGFYTAYDGALEDNNTEDRRVIYCTIVSTRLAEIDAAASRAVDDYVKVHLH